MKHAKHLRSLLALATLLCGCAVIVTPRIQIDVKKRGKLRGELVNNTFYLAASMNTAAFFGKGDRIFADPRPREMLKFYNADGKSLDVPMLGTPILKAGTEVKVTKLLWPKDVSAYGPSAPTQHPWVELQPVEGDGTPVVLVLPRRIASEKDFRRAMSGLLASKQWRDSWLETRDDESYNRIMTKEIGDGMSRGELFAAMGYPVNRGDVDRQDALEVVADYGDLQITLTGGRVAGIVSLRAIAEEKRKKEEEARLKREEEEKARAAAETERLRLEAEARAVKEAAEAEARAAREAKEAAARAEVEAAAEEARKLAEVERNERRAEFAAEQKARREAEQREIEKRLATQAKIEARERAVEDAETEANLKAAKAARAEVSNEVKQRRIRVAADVKRFQRDLEQADAKLRKSLAGVKSELERAQAKKRNAMSAITRDVLAAEKELEAAQKPLQIAKGSKGRKLGLRVKPVDAATAKRAGLSVGQGALVSGVKDGSAGAAAGFMPGDVLLSFDGRDIGSPQDLAASAKDAYVDRKVYAEVWRSGGKRVIALPPLEGKVDTSRVVAAEKALRAVKEREAKLNADEDGKMAAVQKKYDEAEAKVLNETSALREKLARARGDLAVLDGESVSPMAAGGRKLGVHLDPASGAAVDRYRVRGAALVKNVDPNTPAARAGIRAGDLILTYDGKPVVDLGALSSAVQIAPTDRKVYVEIGRGGSKRVVTIGPLDTKGQKASPSRSPIVPSRGPVVPSRGPVRPSRRPITPK